MNSFFFTCTKYTFVPLVYYLSSRKIEGARKPDMYEIIKTDLSESIHSYTYNIQQRVLFLYRKIFEPFV